jgi:hypothetical protein
LNVVQKDKGSPKEAIVNKASFPKKHTTSGVILNELAKIELGASQQALFNNHGTRIIHQGKLLDDDDMIMLRVQLSC